MSSHIVQVGVDVGGTNTDVVVIGNGDILGWSKQTTTSDVTSGVVGAISSALDCASNSLDEGQENVRFGHSVSVERVHIGTTQFVNAVLQKEHLVPVAVIRLCGPASHALPPFSDFPEPLKQVLCGPVYLVDGGYYFDGKKDIVPLNKDEIQCCAQEIREKGIHNIVVSGIFSPVNNFQEQQVSEWIKECYPKASITLSYEMAQLGILLRENSAILNESLKPLSKKVIAAYREALHQLHLRCPLYLTQNDGTLLNIEKAQEFPVFTFASGPTNSMRGAAYLSGVKDAIVLDIGGTSTEAGLLKSGFPRQASSKVEVGGVLTSFQMPDTLSIALGGGSLVKFTEDVQSEVMIGPDTVGNKLRKESIVFGGKKLTATDIAVAQGHCDLGQWESRSHWLPDILALAADNKIHSMVEDIVDRVKTSADEIPVILVGGGSILVDTKRHIKGSSTVLKPQHFQVANAVGAALSQVSAQIDTIQSITITNREEIIQNVKSKVKEMVIQDGANPDTVEIIDIMEVPLTYVTGNATRIRVKAVGDAKLGTSSFNRVRWKGSHPVKIPDIRLDKPKAASVEIKADVNCEPQPHIEVEPDLPNTPVTIDEDTGEWILTHEDFESLAIGAGILGCGGGGNPLYSKIWAQRLLAEGKQFRVKSVKRFCSNANEGDLALPCSDMGAPSVDGEMLYCMQEANASVEAMMDLYSKTRDKDEIAKPKGAGDIETVDGITYIANYKIDINNIQKSNNTIKALIAAEVGGANCITPLIIGAEFGLPVLDCDLMGRAFPELQMCTDIICGANAYPSALGDIHGNKYLCLQADSPKILEDHFRNVCTNMGASVTGRPMTLSDLQERTILYSTSRAWRLGQAVIQARRCKSSPIAAIQKFEHGTVICTGKVTDVQRKTEGGFAIGEMEVQGNGDFQEENYIIHFQNENLIAKKLHQNNDHEVVACVPDLISVVDLETGEPIPTDELRYGLRIAILALPSSPILRTHDALEVVGPKAFGYNDIIYKPVGEYIEHKGIMPE